MQFDIPGRTRLKLPKVSRGFGLALALILTGTPARANEPPTAVIVFDGSGSMWGKPEGEAKTKLVLAREALKQSFAKMPGEARIGLMSYGHRRAGDCNDVETLVKPEAGSTERINAVLDKLNPRGRGPITNALREAAKELGAQSASASIILIHDDLDNCQGDPCTVIGELRRAHPKVAVHVVSVGLKPEDAAKFQCLAKPTGGSHAEVGNAEAAAGAIDRILKTAVIDKMRAPAVAPSPSANAAPVATAAPAPKATPDRPGLQLSAALVDGGPFLDVPIRWRVMAADSSVPVYEQDAAAPFLELAAGKYALEAQYGFVVAKTTIDYVAGTARNVVLPLGAGTVQLAPRSDNAVQNTAIVTFLRTNAPNESAAILRGVSSEVALVPGSYQVTLTVGPTRIERPVTVAAGQRVALEPQLHLGEVEMRVLTGANGSPVDGAVITIFEDDPDAPLGRREIVRSAAVGAVFTLPAGTYASMAQLGGLEVRDRFIVRAGEREQRTMILDVARLTVNARLPGRLEGAETISVRLEKLDEPKETSQVNKATATFAVPAGRYRLEARAGQGSVKAEREIELKSGAQEQATVEIQAGGLKLRLLDPAKATAVADVAWEIRDRSGRPMWLSNQAEPKPLLPPGRYTVRAEMRNRQQVSREIEVRAGETRILDLTAPQ